MDLTNKKDICTCTTAGSGMKWQNLNCPVHGLQAHIRNVCHECGQKKGEIDTLRKENERFMEALNKIADLDPEKDTEDRTTNEWTEAECFIKAQSIAKQALNREG